MNIPEPTTIERIYFEHESRTCSNSEESTNAVRECRAVLLKIDPGATKAEQNDMEEGVYNYGAIERREGFIDGFKYAVKLMGEVYARGGAGE